MLSGLILCDRYLKKESIKAYEKYQEKYKIYILNYNHEKLIQGVTNINICSVAEGLNRILKENTGKFIFVGANSSDYEAISNHKRIFFIYNLFLNDVALEYDYVINDASDLDKIINRIEIKERMIGNYPYEIISYRNSNVTVIYRACYNYFGFLNFTHTNDDDFLIKKLINVPNLLGPFDGNTWYKYRLALNEFDFKLYPDLNNTNYEVNLLLNNGFVIKEKYISTLAYHNNRLAKRALNLKLDSNYSFAIYYKKECYKHLEEVYEIVIDSFTDSIFYEPISKEDFLDLYISNLSFCDPNLVIIYYKNTPIAFSFGYDDPEKRFYVSKTVGIKKNFQNKNIILKLISLNYEIILEKGYDKILYHFQNAKTRTLMNVHKNSKIKEKEYGVFSHD